MGGRWRMATIQDIITKVKSYNKKTDIIFPIIILLIVLILIYFLISMQYSICV